MCRLLGFLSSPECLRWLVSPEDPGHSKTQNWDRTGTVYNSLCTHTCTRTDTHACMHTRWTDFICNGCSLCSSAKGASSPIGNSVRDLLLVAMGPEGEYPHIMVWQPHSMASLTHPCHTSCHTPSSSPVLQTIVDQELLVYRALPPPHPLPSGRLQLQFVKQHHQVMMQQKSASEPFGQKAESEEGREQGTCASGTVRVCMRMCTGYV